MSPEVQEWKEEQCIRGEKKKDKAGELNTVQLTQRKTDGEKVKQIEKKRKGGRRNNSHCRIAAAGILVAQLKECEMTVVQSRCCLQVLPESSVLDS